MKSHRVIMVSSCKGGVGKSTIAANLGIQLAYNGYKTLIIDCDFGVRSLDLIMGLENFVIYDIVDVITKDISPDKAIVQDKRSVNLYFCSAPYEYRENVEPDKFSEVIDKIGEEMEFDYIIIDTPGDLGAPVRLAAAASDMALIVSSYQPSSIRAAERTSMLLDELGVEDRRLIINFFDTKKTKDTDIPNIIDIIDKTCVRLIGVVPNESLVARLQSQGEDIVNYRGSNAAIAIKNIADRIEGHNVPLFTDFKKVKRTSLLKKSQTN